MATTSLSWNWVSKYIQSSSKGVFRNFFFLLFSEIYWIFLNFVASYAQNTRIHLYICVVCIERKRTGAMWKTSQRIWFTHTNIQTNTYAYRYIHICLHIHNYAVCCFVHTLVCAYPLSGKYSFTVSLYVIFTFFTFLNFLTFFNLLTFIFNFNICCFYLTVAFVRLAHTVAALFCYAYACATVSSSSASSFTCTCMPYLCVYVCVRFVGFIFSARTMRRRKWSKCMYIVARFKCANSKRQHMKRKATTTTTK